MGFFWSGRNASIERIFKRSARYWFTSWVGNCMWGPPGFRQYRNDPSPREARELHMDDIRQDKPRKVGLRGSEVGAAWHKSYGSAATTRSGGLRGSTATRKRR